MKVNVVLFSDFETLDVFGPVEIFGKVESLSINYYSLCGGLVENADGIKISTQPFSILIGASDDDILFIPGGQGTRTEVYNNDLIETLKQLAQASKYVLTVCTGSALLAATGLLDGLKATSNKRAFDWVVSTASKVNWVGKARWVIDGKYYTSSGISAGIDMAIGFVAIIYGQAVAQQIAHRIEYAWNSNRDDDAWGREIEL